MRNNTEKEQIREKIYKLIEEFDKKKQIRYENLKQLEALINEYDENIFDRNGLTDCCFDICHRAQYPNKKVYLMNYSTSRCVEHFTTNKECYAYLKEKIKFYIS